MSYRDYFDIDPEYFPQVDKRIIDTQPDLWKKFYPHPSFVAILKATVDVLKRKQKLSVWVDGAYGTGKSHAVLTLKKLIEASDEDTAAYFEKYGLDAFLCKSLTAEKNAGKILVCHRYGSSDISSDTELIVAIQEGIERALAENGIENRANVSLKDALISNFRIDRIATVPVILNENGTPPPDGFDINKYINITFRMFNSEHVEVELICSNDLMDSIIDRFGEDVTTYAYDLESFRAVVNVAVSHIFYSWVFGFGGKVKIKGPAEVRKKYIEMLVSAMQAMDA